MLAQALLARIRHLVSRNKPIRRRRWQLAVSRLTESSWRYSGELPQRRRMALRSHHPNEAGHSTSCWSCFRASPLMQSGKKEVVQRGMPSKIPGREYRASMRNCASRGDPTHACCHQSSMRPRASAMAWEEGSRSLLLRLMLPRAGQQVPEIVVAPARPGKAVVDVRGGSDSRRRPHAGQRKSTIAQLLRRSRGTRSRQYRRSEQTASSYGYGRYVYLGSQDADVWVGAWFGIDYTLWAQPSGHATLAYV